MGDRTSCPGCRSHTSGVLNAFQENKPCPYCGLSAQAAFEIEGVRRRVADAELKARVEELIKEVDQWRGRTIIAEAFKADVRFAVDRYNEEREKLT